MKIHAPYSSGVYLNSSNRKSSHVNGECNHNGIAFSFLQENWISDTVYCCCINKNSAALIMAGERLVVSNEVLDSTPRHCKTIYLDIAAFHR